MNDASGILSTGMVLGLSAGLSPGPLMTLVITETLKRGFPAGARIAVAPLITDAPIIVGSLLVLASLAHAMAVVGGLALLGGGYIAWLGYANLRFSGAVAAAPAGASQLRMGVVANLLNPNPYVFWLTVGGPLLFRAARDRLTVAVLFLALFYGLLIGSKLVVAVAVGRSRHLLRSRTFIWMIRSLGILLIVFAGVFFREGLRYLGWP